MAMQDSHRAGVVSSAVITARVRSLPLDVRSQ